MVTASLISRLSHAVDLIEQRSKQSRPWKIEKVRRGYNEDADVAIDRHYAAHPEDRGTNVRPTASGRLRNKNAFKQGRYMAAAMARRLAIAKLFAGIKGLLRR